MKKTLLSLTVDESNDFVDLSIPDHTKAVQALVDIFYSYASRNNMTLMNDLLALTANVLARETSGNLQRDFIRNVQNAIPVIRKEWVSFLRDRQQKLEGKNTTS